ncbi:hypothetical protein BD560DRAFT_428220 [Blakeslea trispora]|nr:hypothetical protein BD560DRAFT_428220 [Blakeslea trispora]
MKVDNVLVTLLDDCFMMRPNGSLKHGKSKGDAIIVNIFAGERINSSYISAALWKNKGSSESIMVFESCWSVCYSFYQILFALWTLTAIKGPSPCVHVASVMVMRDLKIDIQSRS